MIAEDGGNRIPRYSGMSEECAGIRGDDPSWSDKAISNQRITPTPTKATTPKRAIVKAKRNRSVRPPSRIICPCRVLRILRFRLRLPLSWTCPCFPLSMMGGFKTFLTKRASPMLTAALATFHRGPEISFAAIGSNTARFPRSASESPDQVLAGGRLKQFQRVRSVVFAWEAMTKCNCAPKGLRIRLHTTKLGKPSVTVDPSKPKTPKL